MLTSLKPSPDSFWFAWFLSLRRFVHLSTWTFPSTVWRGTAGIVWCYFLCPITDCSAAELPIGVKIRMGGRLKTDLTQLSLRRQCKLSAKGAFRKYKPRPQREAQCYILAFLRQHISPPSAHFSLIFCSVPCGRLKLAVMFRLHCKTSCRTVCLTLCNF